MRLGAKMLRNGSLSPDTNNKKVLSLRTKLRHLVYTVIKPGCFSTETLDIIKKGGLKDIRDRERKGERERGVHDDSEPKMKDGEIKFKSNKE